MRNHILIYLILLTAWSLCGCHPKGNEIETAVRSQLQLYPNSTLTDIYKSFFQDRFGPGHLVNDSAGARAYFNEELAEMSSRGRYEPEPCGTGGQFYRVPLDLVKDGKIDADRFFSVFLEGATAFRTAGEDNARQTEAWKSEWNAIITVIDGMNLALPGYEQDKQQISEMLSRGEFIIHHSRSYIEAYDPHYRIIRKDLLPALGLR